MPWGSTPGNGLCKTCQTAPVVAGWDQCALCMADEPLSVTREMEGIGNRQIKQTMVCPECGSTNIQEFNESEEDGFVMEPGGVGAECVDCEFRGRGSDFEWIDTPVVESHDVRCPRCGGRSWCDVDGNLCHECASNEEMDMVMAQSKTTTGIGNREIVERPVRACPSCGSESILPIGGVEIACADCPYEGPPGYQQVDESFDSSSLGGGGVADLRSDPIPQSVAKSAAERNEEENVDPEEEERRDAIIDPDHIPMKPDMWGTIPDSGLPSSVGSIGQMPIRLEWIDEGCCPSCGEPYQSADEDDGQPCDRCFEKEMDDLHFGRTQTDVGIGNREITAKPKRSCPSCGSLDVHSSAESDKLVCSTCRAHVSMAWEEIHESVEMTCAECGSAVGGDGLCTDFTCFGSDAPDEQVGDMTPQDPDIVPQGYDHHMDPATPTNTMWKGLGDETPDYRV